MNLSDYTIETGFRPHLKCESLEQAVISLVGVLAKAEAVTSEDGLVHEVLRREAEGSTAVGGGLVIPHARFVGVPEVRLAVATLAGPLEIASADGLPVDIMILLVGPAGDPRQMLRVLARLAKLVRSTALLDTLRAATTAAELEQAFILADDNEG